MANAETPKKTKTHIVAKFVGGMYTRRTIKKAAQDEIIGVKGVAKEDLVWEKGSHAKVDITDCHEDVIAAIRRDPGFKVSNVEAQETS